MRRLSGWTRLWIVVAVSIWAYGGWQTFHEFRHLPLSPQTESVFQVCSEVYARGDTMIGGDYVTECTQDPVIEAGAREGLTDRQRRYWRELGLTAVAWLLAPFLLLLAGGIAQWVRRGFQPNRTT